VETQFGYHLIYKIDERPSVQYDGQVLLIRTKKESDILPPRDEWKNTKLTGAQLKGARVEINQNTGGLPEIALEFNDEGKDLFADITTRNVGKPVAIYLDGQPVTVPRVNEPIKDGKAVITGNFDLAAAKDTAQRLNAGALPVPITKASEQTVGASLGQESLQKSLVAGVWGLLLVIVFMIVYYRLPGVMSSIALLFYGLLVLFVFKMIPVTLSMSGIAGFILSIGMAVDANVLIFERTKEELNSGKPLGTSIDEGFKRAWPSIRDSNVSTLITTFILMWFGTSMIKGFAVTLTIGVLVSMLSAIIITRSLMLAFINFKKSQKMSFVGIKKEIK
jgi:protein-export membrane protein SecD